MEVTPQPQKTILLVDDDRRIIAFVCELLGNDGYDVITATTGQEAIEKSTAHAGEIPLLLSDFQMPGMSGVELATQISAMRPNIKVLLMSGFPEGMLVLNEGWHFLAKPFIASQLLALVREFITPNNASRLTYPQVRQ